MQNMIIYIMQVNLDYLPEYMGDGVFYLASKMIEKYPEKR